MSTDSPSSDSDDASYDSDDNGDDSDVAICGSDDNGGDGVENNGDDNGGDGVENNGDDNRGDEKGGDETVITLIIHVHAMTCPMCCPVQCTACS